MSAIKKKKKDYFYFTVLLLSGVCGEKNLWDPWRKCVAHTKSWQLNFTAWKLKIEMQLVNQLVFWAQSTDWDYTRADLQHNEQTDTEQ